MADLDGIVSVHSSEGRMQMPKYRGNVFFKIRKSTAMVLFVYVIVLIIGGWQILPACAETKKPKTASYQIPPHPVDSSQEHGASCKETEIPSDQIAQPELSYDGIKGNSVQVGGRFAVKWMLPKPDNQKKLELLILTLPNTVRLSGDGFLAIPPNFSLPYNVDYQNDSLRIVFPLYMQPGITTGKLSVLPLRSGDLTITARKIVVDKCGRILGQSAGVDTPAVNVVDHHPRLTIQDRFKTRQPDRTLDSKDDRYKIHVFDKNIEIVDTTSGSKALNLVGHSPSFSTTGRYLTYSTFFGSFEVIDLLDQKTIARFKKVEEIAWTKDDAFVVVKHCNYGGIAMISPLVENRGGPGTEGISEYGRCHGSGDRDAGTIFLDIERAIAVIDAVGGGGFAVYDLLGKSNFLAKRLQNLLPDPVKTGSFDYNKSEGIIHEQRKILERHKVRIPYKNAMYGVFNVPICKTYAHGKDDTVLKSTGKSCQETVLDTVYADIDKIFSRGGKRKKQDATEAQKKDNFINPQFHKQLIERLKGFGLIFNAGFDIIEQKREYAFQDPPAKKPVNFNAWHPKLTKVVEDQEEGRDCDYWFPIDQSEMPEKDLDNNGSVGSSHWKWKQSKGKNLLLVHWFCYSGASGNTLSNEIHIYAKINDNQEFRFYKFGSIDSRLYDAKDMFNASMDTREIAIFSSSLDSIIVVFDIRQQKIIVKIENVGELRKVASFHLSNDKRLLLRVNQDGTFSIYSVRNGNKLVNGYFADNEVIMYDDFGYYDATENIGNFVGWYFSGMMQQFSFQQFSDQFHAPEYIQSLLQGKVYRKQPPNVVAPAPFDFLRLRLDHRLGNRS
ncbi:MAG: hypothetical protein HQM06_13670 [Magnetococcales bacterium]|nr:hypothetical protein [Magnetococcales bacterium]